MVERFKKPRLLPGELDPRDFVNRIPLAKQLALQAAAETWDQAGTLPDGSAADAATMRLYMRHILNTYLPSGPVQLKGAEVGALVNWWVDLGLLTEADRSALLAA